MTSDARRTAQTLIFLGACILAATSLASARQQAPAAPAAQTAPAAAAPLAPPKQLAKLLEKQYGHWQVAPISGGSDGCAAAAKTPSPSVVNLDVNDDGFGDWAMEIQAGANVKFVIAVGWLQDFHLYEIDSAAGSTATRALTMVHRGTSFTNPVTQLQDFYSNDSVLATPCTGAPTVYRWNGNGFTAVVLTATVGPTR
jgi:hypothetical protein